MAKTNFFEFLKEVGSGRPLPPVLAMYGFNEFMGERVIQVAASRHLKERNEFNFKRFYVDNEDATSIADVIREAKTSSFFVWGGRIIVLVIRDIKKIKLASEEKNLLSEYLKQPNPGTCLIFYLSLDILKDDFKQLKKSKIEEFAKLFDQRTALIIDLDQNSENEIKNYVKSFLKEKGVSITASALERIVEIKGDDLVSIVHQLPKLEIGVRETKTLDSEDINEIITGINPHSIWDLTTAIENEDAAKYLDILKYLFVNGIKPSFIIGTLITHYHKIFTAKFLLRQKFPIAEIGKVLQQPSFILNKFVEMTKNFSEKKIQQILKLIYQLDYESKTTGEDTAKILLQNFIFQVKQISSGSSRPPVIR